MEGVRGMQRARAGSLKLNTVGSTLKVDMKKIQARFDREMLLLPLIAIMSLVYCIAVAAPILAIFSEGGLKNAAVALRNPQNISAVKASMLTTAVTIGLVFITGTPVVYLLTHGKRGIFNRILEILVSMPAVLPPAVAGIGLLLAFGRNGLIGEILAKYHAEVVFTPAAVVIAQFFVSVGFYIQVLKTGVDAVSPEIFEISYVMGAGRVEAFIRVIVPMLKKPMAAGLILAWTRALGEFGATMMFAGNVLGKTRTMPLQIYTLMQTDVGLAASMSMVLFMVSFVMLLVIKIWMRD